MVLRLVFVKLEEPPRLGAFVNSPEAFAIAISISLVMKEVLSACF